MREKTSSAGLGALLAVGLVVTGCSGGDGDQATPSGSPSTGNVGNAFSIVEVGFGEPGSVTVKNSSGLPATMDALFLCEAPDCIALPDVTVESGATSLLVIGGDADGAVRLDGEMPLDAGSGELGLYTSTETSAASEIRDYLQWGSTPHEGTAAAVEAGSWPDGAFVKTTPQATRLFIDEQSKWAAQ